MAARFTVVVLDLDTGENQAAWAALADVDQDGTVEIIFASQEGTVRILNPVSGDIIPPVLMRGLCLSCASLRDIDDDGNIEIVAGSSDSLLFILDPGTDVRLVHDDVYPVGSSPSNCEIMIRGALVTTGSASAQVWFRPVVIPCGNDESSGIQIEGTGSANMTQTSITGAITGIESGTSDAYISECTVSWM